MSGAIPFTFFQALLANPKQEHKTGEHAFPLAALVGEGRFKGWAPGMSDSKSESTARPAWSSGHLPPGFERWDERTPVKQTGENVTPGNRTTPSFYSPMDDPLRITNLDQEMLEPLTRALKDHEVPIAHVVLVLMESARKDIFPLKTGSHLHEEIVSSYSSHDPQVLQRVNEKLSNLTPVAEKLTGESGGFMKSRNSSRSQDTEWEDTAAPGTGGINVDGILTGSTLSFKSAVMNYCGMGPLPVDFMDEVKAKSYQPCIMQLFDLFNQLKENSTANDPSGGLESIHGRNWTSVFLQSM
jgi:hypothetical protein